MKKLLILVNISIIFLIGCNSSKNDFAPGVVTIINLDEIENTIETVRVPIKIIYNNEWYEDKPEIKSNFVSIIRDIIEGPDSTIYICDYSNSRIVQLSQHGQFIHSFGGPGSGPGEFSEPYGILKRSENFIYIPDTYGLRLQVFDLFGHYKYAIKNTMIELSGFYITHNDKIFYPPPKHLIPQIPFMILMYDSLGNEIKKIGQIKYETNFVIENNFRKVYSIVADEKTRQLWCIFRFFPIIWRFNYEGELLEEIQFQSNDIDKLFKRRIEILKNGDKPKGLDAGVVLLDNSHILKEKLSINITRYGNVLLSTDCSNTKLLKKYEFIGLPPDLESRASRTMYMLRYFYGKIFAFEWHGIIISGTTQNQN